MLAAPLLCLVVVVLNADTLSVRCPSPEAATPHQQVQVQVHLQGIHAPQVRQPHGHQAREALREIALGKLAELRCSTVQRHQHHVCSVWVAPASAPDGPRTLDAGLAMLTMGLAWSSSADTTEQAPQERGQYAFAEQEAKARKAGLWRTTGAVTPQER